MLTICVTGGLGSGKSLACEIFYNLGCEIFDADIEAKMILFSNPDVKFGLVDRFGKKILNQGKIDKKTLSKLIFSDIQNQQFLNNLVHPLVIQKFLSQKINVKKSIYIMDAALLFEANIQDHFDKTILIFTGQHLRLKRAIKRGNLSHEQILSRMALQMPEDEKRKLASIIIDNNGTIDELTDKIIGLYHDLV